MKNIYKLFFGGMLGAVVLSTALPAMAAKAETEDEYIADLASPKEKVVVAALQGIEKNYPTSAAAQAKIKPLLADERINVKRKAARVLGTLNADVSEADLKNIATLLDATDKGALTDGLKALRGLKAQSTIPKIIPLLQNPDLNVKRDAIRTLAVLGDKKLIPTIQPFVNSPDLAVQKDAADAIEILKAK